MCIRVPSRAFFIEAEMLIFQAFPLFVLWELEILTERGNLLLGFVVYFNLPVYYIFVVF